ncbi:MAG TPA: hypothetical protein VJM76_06170 [Gammaproteobacteria bacterium]|nr:hypothetical protein [Gammaproteobacteria bacterium]
MIEKVGTIKNPLTIIAIFAAIAEISGTMVLPFLPQEQQTIFVWFVVAFPFTLVLLFFGTLNFNSRALYAPSDFRDERNFIKALQKATPEQKAQKLREELSIEPEEINGETLSTEAKFSRKPVSDQELRYGEILRRNAKTNYVLAEELVINKLETELKAEITRDVSTDFDFGNFLFDGFCILPGKVYGIEVKYYQSENFHRGKLNRTLNHIQGFVNLFKGKAYAEQEFSLILALVTDAPLDKHEALKEHAMEIINKYDFPIDLRIYNLADLEKEAGLVES